MPPKSSVLRIVEVGLDLDSRAIPIIIIEEDLAEQRLCRVGAGGHPGLRRVLFVFPGHHHVPIADRRRGLNHHDARPGLFITDRRFLTPPSPMILGNLEELGGTNEAQP